ncbi:MAG: transposase, partial [Sulfuricaulis sp.]
MSDTNATEAKRRKYTEAFKTEAVRLLQETDKSIAQVARELGINPNLLSRWRREEHHAQV